MFAGYPARSSLIVGCLLLPVVAALAQQTSADQNPSSQSNDGLQEIVVTAQRRAQSVLSVPMSIQAVTGDQLNNTGITELRDLAYTTPGYLVDYSAGYSQVFIRGIGNSIFVGADPSVATFIDDVPRIYGSLVQNFVDVDRVEVLKGAQGGLYGRNATGGVINIITRQPSTTSFETNALIDYGEKDTLRAAGYVNLPINDMIAVSVAIERDSHHPYVRNLLTTSTPYTAAMFPTGSAVGTPTQTAALLNSQVHPLNGYADQDFWSGNLKVLVKPTDNFKITFSGDWNDKIDTGGNDLYNATPGVTQAFTSGLLGAFGFNPQIPAGFIRGAAGAFTTTKGVAGTTDLRDDGGSATAVLSLPGVDITSISAYRTQRTDYYDDFAETTVPLVLGTVINDKHFFYQELRAASTSESSLHWLGGATYLNNHFHGDTAVDTLPPILLGAPSIVSDTIHNWSVYGQAGYDFTSALNLTASGRFVHETNQTLFTQPIVSGTASEEQKFLPSSTLSYKVGDGGTTYARYARGFKAGGVNPLSPPSTFPGSVGSIFGPETVDTYEVGYRAPLFNRTVQFTSAVFYNDYKGLQANVHANAQNPQIIEAIVNAGAARTYGAEGSVTWRPTAPLTFGINAGYLNAKYTKFSVESSPILASFNLDGTQMINSPKFQLSLSANIDQPLNDRLRLVGNVLQSYVTSVIYNQSGEPGVLPNAGQGGYGITNLRIGVRTTDDHYGFSIYANNLFDRGYAIGGSSEAGLGNILEWGTPRIIGGEFTAKY
jgi:iron complex outermembrane recepter protein